MQQFAAAAVVQPTTGSPIQIPYNGIYQHWWASGAQGGYLGWPIAAQQCSAAACSQQFQGGIVTTDPAKGTFGVIGGFVDAWGAFGGLSTVGVAIGSLRYSTANGGGWAQQFNNGTITQAVGSSPVFTPNSSILSTWYYYGAEFTWLGWPLSAPTCDANGCIQYFQHGVGRSNSSGGVSFTGS